LGDFHVFPQLIMRKCFLVDYEYTNGQLSLRPRTSTILFIVTEVLPLNLGCVSNVEICIFVACTFKSVANR